MQSKKVIKLSQVIAKTSLCKSTIYTLLASNKFPQKILLSSRRIGFLEAEIDAWLIAKTENSK